MCMLKSNYLPPTSVHPLDCLLGCVAGCCCPPPPAVTMALEVCPPHTYTSLHREQRQTSVFQLIFLAFPLSPPSSISEICCLLCQLPYSPVLTPIFQFSSFFFFPNCLQPRWHIFAIMGTHLWLTGTEYLYFRWQALDNVLPGHLPMSGGMLASHSREGVGAYCYWHLASGGHGCYPMSWCSAPQRIDAPQVQVVPRWGNADLREDVISFFSSLLQIISQAVNNTFLFSLKLWFKVHS